MSPRRHLSGAAGFGMVEVMASLALFSVVAVGVSAAIVSGTRANFLSRMQAAASALAQNKIEQIRALAPSSGTVPADLTLGAHTDPANPITGLEGTSGKFTRTWTVSGVKMYLGSTVVGLRPNMVRVEVHVTWTKPSAGDMTVVTYTCTTSNCGAS
ncbi:MAG: prepilin-type N-terminal cleavage/methylation domain-containing protein [Alphaproteobacteria bacterium]